MITTLLVFAALAQDPEPAEEPAPAPDAPADPAPDAPADDTPATTPDTPAEPDAPPPGPLVTPLPDDDHLLGPVALVVGLRGGGAVPFTPLRFAPTTRLEAGVELPVLDRRLRILLGAAVLRPVVEGTLDDPRVAGETWSYTLHQTEWHLTLAPSVRIPDLGWPVVPEVAVGPALTLLRTRSDGDGNASTSGEHVEEFTRAGIFASLGIAWAIGPGEATFHLDMNSSALRGTLTGQAPTAALAPQLGYRLVL